MTEIFKWGVSIFLSLCGIAALCISLILLAMLSEASPATFELVFSGILAVITFLTLLWAAANVIHIWLFE